MSKSSIPRWKSAHDGLTRLCLVSECTSVFVEQKLSIRKKC